MSDDRQTHGRRAQAETSAERQDRQMIELLNELRVALPGVQILFAFLLTVPFTNRFGSLNGFQRDVYYITLVCALLSVACFIAPSAGHRLLFHQGEREWLIASANRLAVAGLVFLALALSASILLITDVLFKGAQVWVYSGAIACLLAGMWFVRPLLRRARRDEQEV
jgi:hypothetical protein